jgi:hypothetical protein
MEAIVSARAATGLLDLFVGRAIRIDRLGPSEHFIAHVFGLELAAVLLAVLNEMVVLQLSGSFGGEHHPI